MTTLKQHTAYVAFLIGTAALAFFLTIGLSQ